MKSNLRVSSCEPFSYVFSDLQPYDFCNDSGYNCRGAQSHIPSDVTCSYSMSCKRFHMYIRKVGIYTDMSQDGLGTYPVF